MQESKLHDERGRIRIGISHGDINGVGYEVILKSLLDNHVLEFCTPVIYGSPKVASYHKKVLNIDTLNLHTIRSIDEVHDKRINIINCADEEIRVELGKSTPAAGEAAFQALEMAVKDLKNGKIHALITSPINKANIQSEKFRFSGHTEYLQSAFATDEVLMLMVSSLLKVGVVAGHVAIAKVPELITKERILAKLRVLNSSLLKDFGIRKPKIAVLGLNPHAGDEGLLGTEEQSDIIPAIQEANKENILAFGPYPADGFFGSGNFTKFDAVLAMYHDQGLIPFKTMVVDEGVNYTAGLPVVRTSPAHGTAYEITGKDEAAFGSFRNAIYFASDIYKNRKMYKEISQNPLPFGLPEELQSGKE
jgi:4-hydroxythreonine-4-phosphate dehydrogenase